MAPITRVARALEGDENERPNSVEGYSLDDLAKAPVVFLEFLEQSNLKKPEAERLAELSIRMMVAHMEHNSVEENVIVEELMSEIGFDISVHGNGLYGKVLDGIGLLVTKLALMIASMGGYARNRHEFLAA